MSEKEYHRQMAFWSRLGVIVCFGGAGVIAILTIIVLLQGEKL